MGVACSSMKSNSWVRPFPFVFGGVLLCAVAAFYNRHRLCTDGDEAKEKRAIEGRQRASQHKADLADRLRKRKELKAAEGVALDPGPKP